ncbi:MAG: cystathionine beta-lyase [Burkholderiaceae bacterium]|nr:cystathionine beta-lyase [Burkholderiaceae bacterium]
MADHDATALIHHPYQPPAGFEAPQPGVFKASTVIFPDVATMRARDWKHKHGYTYGLHGTPTTFTLEERVAHLDHGLQCVLAPSGLAAIALVDMALLQQGDEVLIPANAYGPGKDFAVQQLAGWGIGHRFYDPLDAAGFAALIGPATKLVWLEAPGSVTMEFPDMRGLVAAARARGVLTALDNTWGAGIAFDGFDLGDGLGCDIVMQALTKFPSGGGDVLMGSVTTHDEALHLKIKLAHMRLGLGVAANDAELVLRSLPSIALRYHAHDRTARALATWLQQRPEITRVLHPALAGSPGHEHWRGLCGAAAGLFSVVFAARYSPAQVDAFCDALRLFKLGYSWGGPVSLVVPYDLRTMRDPVPYEGTLVRFSIGLEDEADLRADLAQAFASLG